MHMMASIAAVRQRVTRVRTELCLALSLSVALLLYGNLTSLASAAAREHFLLWSNLGVLAVLLVWAFGRVRLSLRETGLDPANARGSAMYGLAICAIASVPPLLFILLAPLFNGGPVEEPEITSRSGTGMAYFLLFRQPVGTGLFEEVTFRGVLYGAWQRAAGDRGSFLATSATFALWHVVITSKTVAESDVVGAAPAIAAGVVVSIAGLFIGGLIFAYLRWHTQSIVAPALAHWLIVASMAAAIWTVG
jgi:membrane protease YdiL (CAAX protease family)